LRENRIWFFVLSAAAGSLLMVILAGGIVYLRGRFEYGRQLAALNTKLAEQASTDALTGCANRRQFMALLDKEWHRSTRHDFAFCVLLLDLDRFKAINDTYGHGAGDEALRHFVKVISPILRATDILGRLGGDEFAILLPQTELASARKLAERIRDKLGTTPLQPCGQTMVVTLSTSIGAAQWQAEQSEALEDLLSRADKDLYLAKNTGRTKEGRASLTS
jgi:diguanylate cyclase (GGDEF)-like protein